MKLGINGATTMPYSLEEDIRSAAEAGFEAVEVWYSKLKDYLQRHSIEELKALLETSRLEVSTLCPTFIRAFSGQQEAVDEIRRAADLARQLGCSTILACPDTPPEGMAKVEAIRIFSGYARQAAAIAGEYGVRIALEPLGGHPLLDGPAAAQEIIELAGRDNLGLMMDTFHYYKSGITLEAIEEIPVALLYIIHINDCVDLPLIELQDKDRLYPTEGIIPAVDMLRPLVQKGYTGTLSVEVFRPEYWQDPVEEISRQAAAYGKRLLAQLKEE